MGIAAGAAFVAPAVNGQTAGAARFTLVDRTLVCTTARDPGWGYRNVSVSASPRAPSSLGSRWDDPGSASVSTEDFGLVSVSMGEFGGRPGGVFINRDRCRRVKTRIALSSAGLPKPPIRFGTESECRGLGGRIIVRVRARFTSPTTWFAQAVAFRDVPEQTYLRAQGKLSEAYLAVRTYRTRKPLSFAAINEKGESRFYGSPRCE